MVIGAQVYTVNQILIRAQILDYLQLYHDEDLQSIIRLHRFQGSEEPFLS
jgi:hypothetical protein